MLARIDAVASRLRERFGDPPAVAVVLGSGLGAFAEHLTERTAVRYPDLGLPQSGVAGHAGELVVGRAGDRRVAAFSGRLHLYEGHPVEDVVLGVRAIARWGVGGLILTSAVGGIEASLRPGQIVVIRDHINLLGVNPLRGPNLAELGPRFPDLSRLYTPRLRALAHAVNGEPLREGVYGAMPGPSYETPAEIRMLGRLGADVVGMSMVPEAIAAGHAGMEVLGISVVSNAAAGLADEVLAHADVTAAMNAAGARVSAFLEGVVARW
jgi:purine-nucleoside phosphorylase